MKKMDFETDFAKEFENFKRRCLELEEKSNKNEIRCLMLEFEVTNLKKSNQELEAKIEAIQKMIVDSTYVKKDSENLLHDVLVENKVLECEKQKAETELCFWKEKAKELESNINGMNEKAKDIDVVSNKKMAPCTPGIAQSPFNGIIDISDEDANCNENDLAKNRRSSKNNLQKTNLERIDEEHMDNFNCRSSNTRSANRKRAAKIVTSDDENSYDDNAPICTLCTLKTHHSSRVETTSEEEVEENVSKRYVKRLRRLGSKNEQDKTSIDLHKTFSSSEDEDDNDGGDELQSQGESLSGFIVDGSQSVSEYDSESGAGDDESEDVLNEYKVTLDNIGRKKISNFKWDLEGDMLSNFAKDPELCMRAVCALYRRQTDDEKESKFTIHQNERGFNQPDAPGASRLAEFLTDGDPGGDVKKTVEELIEYDTDGIKLCRKLAVKYSKQLFSIYQNNEDPYLMPT